MALTLGEMKKKVLSLIEEIDTTQTNLTNDPDIAAKLPYVINQIQYELARVKKISAKFKKYVTEEEEYKLTKLENFYQLDLIRCVDDDGNSVEIEVIGDLAIFPTDGEAFFYYYKYPTRIDGTTEDTYEFELSDDVLEIMPYGVAGDLLKSDVSNAYGNIYSQRYEQLKSQIDIRYDTGSIYIDSGIEV